MYVQAKQTLDDYYKNIIPVNNTILFYFVFNSCLPVKIYTLVIVLLILICL